MPKSKTNMTPQHKAALAKGREEGLAVRRYLEAIESTRPKRGRRRTPASITKRLEGIEAELATADPLTRLHLIQQKKDLSEELGRNAETEDIDALEKQFVTVAKTYGDRKGISYGTWRTAGVSAAVLQKAGVPRTRGCPARLGPLRPPPPTGAIGAARVRRRSRAVRSWPARGEA
jgi:hypothetical protein